MELYKNSFDQGMTFGQYMDLIEESIQNGHTTSSDSSEQIVEYTRLNMHRMKRILKTIELTDELIRAARDAKGLHILIISEGWCGDAAQSVPVVAALTERCSIPLRVVLRDKHDELMNHHLTNGSRSIPVVLFLNENFDLCGSWGPRPAPAQRMMIEYKKSGGDKPYSEFTKELQQWYNNDHQQTIMKELTTCIRQCA